VVKSSKRFFVESHQKTAKHKKQVEQPNQSTQTFLPAAVSDFSEEVTRAFLSANIPLHKLHNKALRKLFENIGHSLPSATTCRNKVGEIASADAEKLKECLRGKEIFMVIDESDISGKQYLNILVGLLNQPQVTFMFDCQFLQCSANGQLICRVVDDAIRSLGIDRKDFCLLLSDAARYMQAAGKTLKQLYPRLFHVTCMAHLLHNCAMKVRAQFIAVDELIARVKAATVKNKTRKAFFAEIGSPPEPIVTRWASWLDAARYYAEKLPQVVTIVESFDDSGIIVERAKASVQHPELAQQLLEIQLQYAGLANLVTKMESSEYTVTQAYQDVKALNFGDDKCKIGEYIAKRLQQNDIVSIMSMSREDISPLLYSLLQNCQPTSASVERSFSMLGKLLAKDRNFKPENITNYLTVYYNASNM
jgi:hypothetical protein